MDTNVLYYGDNLDILRKYVPNESVDLVYLDPPFNSNRDYNVIFKDESGRKSDAQLLAFEDTWHWGPSAEETYRYLTNTAYHGGRVPSAVSQLVAALRAGIGTNQMLAYLVEMTVRLGELHRVLKPTGSLWLHCDPTASHYLKLVLDSIFDPRRFIGEVVWKRTSSHNDPKRPGRIHDVLLYYSKSEAHTWNPQNQPLDQSYLDKVYVYNDARGRYRLGDLTAPHFSATRTVEWRGATPAKTRQWRFSIERMEELLADGRIQLKADGTPSMNGYKLYLEDSPGAPLQDIWDDIPNVTGISSEKLGWPTQKPIALLERILACSSNPGDVVLDPFCGCGTALVAAQKLDRKWVGIDVTYLSITVMQNRLMRSFGLEDVPIIGQPTEVEGARQLAQSPEGRYQFQWWALALVHADPIGGVEKKGSDRGIDGIITFTDKNNDLQSVLVSVKSGGVNSGMVRDLKGTIEREKAAIGLFVTLEEPTKEMRLEASTAGIFHSELWNRDYPRIQLLSIRELLEEHRRAELPPFVLSTYQQAGKIKPKTMAEQKELFG